MSKFINYLCSPSVHVFTFTIMDVYIYYYGIGCVSKRLQPTKSSEIAHFPTT